MNLNLGRLLLHAPRDEYDTHAHVDTHTHAHVDTHTHAHIDTHTHMHTHAPERAKTIWLKEQNGFF